jgi:hypothetical protein
MSEMDRSGLELSIDNWFTTKHWKLNEKNIEVCRAVTTVKSIIPCVPHSTTRLNFQSPLLQRGEGSARESEEGE